MRDAIAAIVALVLLVVAASLATTLQAHRRRRQRQRDSEQALGRRIVAEIPAGDDFLLVSEDASRFYYGEQSIDKDLIVAVRVLINGAPLASYVSRRHAKDDSSATTAERGVGAPAKRDRGAGAPGVIEERGAGVPAERVRGEGAPGVNKDRGVGAPAKRDRGAGAPGVNQDRGVGGPARQDRGTGAPGVIDDRLEGILRDRWDVAVEKVTGTVLVECGAIRERVSQELARKIFDAIKTELEQRDRT